MSRTSLLPMLSSTSHRLGRVARVDEYRSEQGSGAKAIGTMNSHLTRSSLENRAKVPDRMCPAEEYFNRLFSCPEIFRSIAVHLHQRDIRSFSLVSKATAIIIRFAGRGSISNGCAPWTCGGLQRKSEYRGFCTGCYIPGCDRCLDLPPAIGVDSEWKAQNRATFPQRLVHLCPDCVNRPSYELLLMETYRTRRLGRRKSTLRGKYGTIFT
ncbi:hypothetical protein EV426DRAFT_616502 [Tirmania nivea]|nr:hypothetical protein EV426DRAFT_616502 [Tirmania nivea]